jgi:hypothetical protein
MSLVWGCVSDARVECALRTVDRADFVPDTTSHVYADEAIGIGHGATVSAPTYVRANRVIQCVCIFAARVRTEPADRRTRHGRRTCTGRGLCEWLSEHGVRVDRSDAPGPRARHRPHSGTRETRTPYTV